MPGTIRSARWATSLLFFLNGSGIGLWSAHIPLVRDRTGIDTRLLGFALLAVAGGAMAAMPVAGVLTARHGSRRVTLWAALGFAVMAPILIASPNVATLFGAAIAFGALNGAMDVAMNAHAAEVESRRGAPTMSSFHAFFSLGGMAGAALGGLLIGEGLGNGRGAALVGVFMLVAIGAAAPRLLAADRASTAASHWVMPTRAVLLLGMLALLCMAVEGALVDWSALLMRERTGATAASAATGYSAFSIAMAACRFAGDGLVVRLGALRVMIVGGLCIGLGLLVSVLSSSYLGVAGGFVLIGLGAANVVPLIFGAAARIPGMSAGTGVATAATVGYTGFLLGPPVIGWVAAATSLTTALGLLALAGAFISINARAVNTDPGG